MIHTMACLTTTNCKHFQVLCMLFEKGMDEVREMDQVRDAEGSGKRLTDNAQITLISQISILIMGEVIEVFIAKHLL